MDERTTPELPEYWSPAELRAYLRLDPTRSTKRWQRLRPFFAPALRIIGTHQLYHAPTVREILEAGRALKTPLAISRAGRRALRALG